MIDRRAQRDNSISIFRIIAVVCAVCVLVYFIFALATGIEPIATVIACALLCIFLCIFIYLTLNPDSVRSQYTEETLSVASAMLEDIKGGLTQESALLVCRRILPETRAMTVAITDEGNVLACAGEFEEKLLPDSPIHTLATRYVIEHGIVQSFNRVVDVVGSDGSHNQVPAGIIAPIKVGERTAEIIKIKIGSILPFEDGREKDMIISGQDVVTEQPREVTIQSEDVRAALQPPIEEMVVHIKETFKKTNPDLASDIISNGILLTGGGVVKTPENYAALHQNGRIYQLLRPLELLPTDGRPLSQGADLAAMWAERAPLYERFRDAAIDNSGTVGQTAQAIWRDFCENSGH